MSEHKQNGTASHLPGAEVRILDAGRHFGAVGLVVARTVFLGQMAAMVRLQTFRKGKAQIVHVAIPDTDLERTPQSLVARIVDRSRVLAGTLRPAVLSLVAPIRSRLTTSEYVKRQSRLAMADASRKRNRR